MLLSSLFIKNSPGKGRAVFTEEDIAKGSVIEIAPVIAMSAGERIHLDKTLLHDYIFEWGLKKEQCAMALGLIPIYNHSYNSNCEYMMDYESSLMAIKTIRDIKAGEEVTINYNGDWNDQKKVWFEAK